MGFGDVYENVMPKIMKRYLGSEANITVRLAFSSYLALSLLQQQTLKSREIANRRVPISGLYCGDLSARILLVLFCVCFTGVFGPHSGEGLPIAERVKSEYSGILRQNGEVTEKFRV